MTISWKSVFRFGYIRTTLRPSKKWLCIEQLKASELVAKIRLPEQKHHRNPVIKRLFDGFLVDLPVSGHIEINGLTIGDEELVLRILVFPSHHPRPHQI